MTMVVEFECRKCGKVVSHKRYELDRFCPDCGTYLQVKILKIDRAKLEKRGIRIEIDKEDINVDSLFYKFKNYGEISVGDGIVFKSVDAWISARKQVYMDFRKRFSLEKLLDFDYLSRVFKDWLLFRNNLSWTTFHRTGYQALKIPDRLVELIILLRNDKLDVGTRVQRGLRGKEKVIGIGQGILTALLHTFFDDKYCVWNSRTQDTLRILRRPPPRSYSNIGETYKDVNTKLHELARELGTDLTTIDGFVWFISKEGIFR